MGTYSPAVYGTWQNVIKRHGVPAYAAYAVERTRLNIPSNKSHRIKDTQDINLIQKPIFVFRNFLFVIRFMYYCVRSEIC